MTHTQLVKAGLDLLESLEQNGIAVYSIKTSTGKIRTKEGRFFTTGKEGCPDIVFCYQGNFIGCEMKVGKDKQSDKQKKAQKQIEKAGGLYILCHDSLENLREVIKYDRYMR